MNHNPEVNWPRTMLVPVVGISLYLVTYFLNNNQDLFLAFNNWAAGWPVAVWSHFTLFGDAGFILALGLLFVGRKPRLVSALILSVIIAGFIGNSLKDMLDIVRPPGVFGTEAIHVHGPIHTTDAFPSGHSLTAWLFVSLLVTSLASRWRYVLIPLAVMVSLSRVALGVHWPQDVLAGMILGWILGQFSVYLASRWDYGTRPLPQRIFTLILLADCLGLYWYPNGHAETMWLQYLGASLCLLSLVSVFKHVFVSKDIHTA